MAQLPVDSSPQTSDYENISPEASGNFGGSDWTEADDSSAAEATALSAIMNGFTSGTEVEMRESGGRELFSTFREIEVAGHKVADFTKTAAADISNKLFGGGSGEASSDRGDAYSISRLTEGVSSWWSSLDATTISPEAGLRQPASASASQVSSDAQLFALPATEVVLESFGRCTLLQIYTCSHNSFTPDREVGWKGKLLITDRQSCWRSDPGSDDFVTLMLPHSDVSSAHKVTRGGKEILQVKFGDKEQLSLRFTATKDAAAALALLEHVTTSS